MRPHLEDLPSKPAGIRRGVQVGESRSRRTSVSLAVSRPVKRLLVPVAATAGEAATGNRHRFEEDMMSKTFRRIAVTTVALAGIVSASAAFAKNDLWPHKGPANLYLPGATTQLDTSSALQFAELATPAPRGTSSAPQAPVSTAPSGMSFDRDLTGRTSTTSLSSTSGSNPYATFANPYGTIVNPYERNPTTDTSGH